MEDVRRQSNLLVDLLASPLPSSILHNHPNDIGADLIDYLDISPSPINRNSLYLSSWWNWASQGERQWRRLIGVHNDLKNTPDDISMPKSVLELLVNVKKLSLLRYPGIVSLLNVGQADITSQLLDSKVNPNSERVFKLMRTTANRNNSQAKRPTGMTPKKDHEVSRMTECVRKVLEDTSNALGVTVQHIVDIGAGQKMKSRVIYLVHYRSWLMTRPFLDRIVSAHKLPELQARLRYQATCSQNLHILALDSSLEQVKGAERRANARRSNNRDSRSSLTFRTVWLGDAPSHESHPGQYCAAENEYSSRRDLEVVIDDWLNELPGSDADAPSCQIPIAFVALHACGSLTPNILRKALSLRRNASNRPWFVAAVVVVGCCYNLLEAQDFPLSKSVSGHIKKHHPEFKLTYGHLQLAAQVPSNWLRDREAETRAELSIKKVLYRALITPALAHTEDADTQNGFDKTKRRLGKLNDKYYENFEMFLGSAGKKMEVDLTDRLSKLLHKDPRTLENTDIARRIEVLQALRCILGPPIESLIILDRILWLWENMSNDQDVGSAMHLELLNVFDQATDSGRNIVIVVHEGRSSNK